MTVLSTDGRRLIFPPPPPRVLDVLPRRGMAVTPFGGSPRTTPLDRISLLVRSFFVHSTRGGGAVGGNVSDGKPPGGGICGSRRRLFGSGRGARTGRVERVGATRRGLRRRGILQAALARRPRPRTHHPSHSALAQGGAANEWYVKSEDMYCAGVRPVAWRLPSATPQPSGSGCARFRPALTNRRARVTIPRSSELTQSRSRGVDR